MEIQRYGAMHDWTWMRAVVECTHTNVPAGKSEERGSKGVENVEEGETAMGKYGQIRYSPKREERTYGKRESSSSGEIPLFLHQKVKQLFYRVSLSCRQSQLNPQTNNAAVKEWIDCSPFKKPPTIRCYSAAPQLRRCHSASECNEKSCCGYGVGIDTAAKVNSASAAALESP